MIGSLFLSDIPQLSTIVPPMLKAVRVLPGKTLGAFYFCKFGPGSEIEYNEFVIFPALVHYGRKFGFFGQKMYVDNAEAIPGIYESSGIPKEIASFNHDPRAGTVFVSKDEKPVCFIKYRLGVFFQLKNRKYNLPGFGAVGKKLINLKGVVSGELGLANVRIEVPTESPMPTPYLRRSLFGFRLSNFNAELFYRLGEYDNAQL